MEHDPSGDAEVVAPLAEAVGAVEFAQVQARESLTPQHLWAALHFARLCEDRECEITQAGSGVPDLAQRSYAMATVKFAVSFLESLVNDLLSDAADPHMSTMGRMTAFTPDAIRDLAAVWDEERRYNLVGKYQQSLAIVGAEQFEKSDPVYRAVSDLVFLRNELVHYKVGWQLLGAKQNNAPAIERRLKHAFPPNRQEIGEPWFPNKCLASGCARWACDSAKAFANAWLDRLSLQRDYEQVLRDLGAP